MISVPLGCKIIYEIVLNLKFLRMVILRAKYGRDQDYINSKLRPTKQRFPRGRIEGASERMRHYGMYHLRHYRPQIELRFFL